MRAEDREYDAFAVFDSVPEIVEGLDTPGARYLALLSAFVGIDTEFLYSPRKARP
jgi:hypothetical protein